jgi:hypothetical protein
MAFPKTRHIVVKTVVHKRQLLFETSLSYILDKTGRIAIGLKSSWAFGASVLGMGDILEIFQAEGNELASLQGNELASLL